MGSRGSSLPDGVHYKRVTVPSNITLGQSVFNYLVNDVIPDCSAAFITLHWDFNGSSNPPAYHFVSLTIIGLENKEAKLKEGCRYVSGYKRVNIDTTYDMQLTAGDVLDVYYLTSEE